MNISIDQNKNDEFVSFRLDAQTPAIEMRWTENRYGCCSLTGLSPHRCGSRTEESPRGVLERRPGRNRVARGGPRAACRSLAAAGRCRYRVAACGRFRLV